MKTKIIEPKKVDGYIGVDLDGTLAHYSPKNWPEIGEPIPKMLEVVKTLLAKGVQVRIITARVAGPPDKHGVPTYSKQIAFVVKQWLFKHLGQHLPVQFWRDFQMLELWDDRCIQVAKNEGTPIVNIAGSIAAIGEKLYAQQLTHRGYCSSEAWETFRQVLGIPKQDKKLILTPEEALRGGG